MSKTRIYTLGTVALVLVMLIAGWMLGISPMLTSISAAQAQAATTRQTNVASQTQLASLQTQYKGLSKLKKTLSKLRLSIPEDESASAFLNEIATLCASNGVTLTTITLANATLYVDPAAATAAAAAPATTGSTETPAPTTAATTPAATTTTTTSGLVLIPVSIIVKGGFDNVRDYVDAAQNGTRLLYASQVEYSTSTDGSTSATITGDIFALKGTSDSAPVKVKTLPNSTATPTPTMTPTPTPTSSTASTTNKSGGTAPSTAPTTAPTTPSTPDPSPTS